MTDRQTSGLTHCDIHGVFYREEEKCAKCEAGAPGLASHVGGPVSPGENGFPVKPLIVIVTLAILGAAFTKMRQGRGRVVGEGKWGFDRL